jgi:hypothetical protein
MAINKIKTNSISDSAVTSATIQDSAVTNAKISACAAIAQSKVTGLATSLSTLCSSATSLTGLINTNQFNIGLLGFKMAVSEGLTVFNLVDGIVDEFQDESGVDNSASTSLTYNSTDDYYVNSTQPTGISVCATNSAGFSTTTITEPDTSSAGTNPTYGTGTFGTYTVPVGITSVTGYVWGASGGESPGGRGGPGGFVKGTLAVSPGQSLYISAGEAGQSGGGAGAFFGGTDVGASGSIGGEGNVGGGVAGIFSVSYPTISPAVGSPTAPGPQAPQVILVAGAGAGSIYGCGGAAGGGLTGFMRGAPDGGSAQTNAEEGFGGGGGQTQGGQAPSWPHAKGQAGSFLKAGDGAISPFGPSGAAPPGGAGWYGGAGGGSANPQVSRNGGGGSSYYGHPQITSASTQAGQSSAGLLSGTVGGENEPLWPQTCNAGKNQPTGPTPVGCGAGNDGYVFITSFLSLPATTTTSTIISDPFTSTTVPTTTRMVVFEENIDTPTLNTDIIASVSRNGGTNFTNVTLADSGYVTGSSGQRILTGTATISGQPSGQSMKWKLQLANNTVKIHGVALQWS